MARVPDEGGEAEPGQNAEPRRREMFARIGQARHGAWLIGIERRVAQTLEHAHPRAVGSLSVRGPVSAR